jgi:hypothetical protein
MMPTKHYITGAALGAALKADARFAPTLDPTPGAVIISPRTATKNGHTGIFLTTDRIASNDSLTGKFNDNYSFAGWATSFLKNRGLHVYIFKPSA